MKNIVGTPARQDNFYPRDREIERIIERIEDGNNIHIAAPRRIGKTSILFHLLDNKVNNHIYVFVDTEGIDNEQAFFKKLFKEILQSDEIKQSRRFKHLLETGNKFFKRIKCIKVLEATVDFQEPEEKIIYKEELENLLRGLELESDVKLILMIDEFPQVIQNILLANPENKQAAVRFVQQNRELRLNPEINGKVIFVYTGSIGLNHTVSMIEASAFVNDLSALEVEALNKEEAKELLEKILSGKKLVINEDASDCLMEMVEWLVPFYIQLAAQEKITLARGRNEITREIVTQAFENIVATRNNNHFEDYFSRLKKHFKNRDFEYANEILCYTVENGAITKTKAANFSAKYGLQERWRHILEILEYDGYINNVGDKNTYRFNSPILKMWWQRFVCN